MRSHALAGVMTAILMAGGAFAASPQDGYAAWKAAHPKAGAEIAAVKAKTAAMIKVRAAPEQSEASFDKPAVIWRIPGAIASVWDGPDAPEMVVIPAGEYTMGWKASEPVVFSAT